MTLLWSNWSALQRRSPRLLGLRYVFWVKVYLNPSTHFTGRCPIVSHCGHSFSLCFAEPRLCTIFDGRSSLRCTTLVFIPSQQAIELEAIFDASTLDEDALFTLMDASANPDISRLLNAPWFLNVLRAVRALSTATPEMKKACR